MSNTITTLHGLDVWLRAGNRYRTGVHELFFLDGRFYVHAPGQAPQPYTTVGMAVVALLFAVGSVEVPHE